MARACGLRLGSRRYELVVLDGTPKKPKLIECFSGDLPPHTPEFAKQRRAALKAVFKRVGKGLDNLGVALDVRGAAFRRQNVPLSDTSKIESVLKYEVEGQLPQFNIDDVSVDWMVLDQAGDSSSLLVTAVPIAAEDGKPTDVPQNERQVRDFKPGRREVELTDAPKQLFILERQ